VITTTVQKEKEGASHKNNDEIHNMVILHL
jgi:hypothetical protein